IALVHRRVGWALVLFFLAFESKESALAVPLALALLAGTRRAYAKTSLRLGLFIAACVFSVVALILLAYLNQPTVGVGAAQQISPLRYLLTETRVVFTYLRLLVFPYPQSLEYEFQNAGGFFSVVGIAVLVLAAWLLRQSMPGLTMLAFFILLVPTSSFIP